MPKRSSRKGSEPLQPPQDECFFQPSLASPTSAISSRSSLHTGHRLSRKIARSLTAHIQHTSVCPHRPTATYHGRSWQQMRHLLSVCPFLVAEVPGASTSQKTVGGLIAFFGTCKADGPMSWRLPSRCPTIARVKPVKDVR